MQNTIGESRHNCTITVPTYVFCKCMHAPVTSLLYCVQLKFGCTLDTFVISSLTGYLSLHDGERAWV